MAQLLRLLAHLVLVLTQKARHLGQRHPALKGEAQKQQVRPQPLLRGGRDAKTVGGVTGRMQMVVRIQFACRGWVRVPSIRESQDRGTQRPISPRSRRTRSALSS